ncbi:hypothetical protein ACLMJK_007020 [Lecanora helva]
MHAPLSTALVLLIAGKALSQTTNPANTGLQAQPLTPLTDPLISPNPTSAHNHNPPAQSKDLDTTDTLPARAHPRAWSNIDPGASPFGPVRRDGATPAGRGGGYQGVPTPGAG